MDKIISRHPGVIAWLASKGIQGEAIPHLESKDIVEGDTLYGVLPVPLIKEALDKRARVYLLVLPSVAFSDRGKELTPAEMDSAGAKILEVKNLEVEEVSLDTSSSVSNNSPSSDSFLENSSNNSVSNNSSDNSNSPSSSDFLEVRIYANFVKEEGETRIIGASMHHKILLPRIHLLMGLWDREVDEGETEKYGFSPIGCFFSFSSLSRLLSSPSLKEGEEKEVEQTLHFSIPQFLKYLETEGWEVEKKEIERDVTYYPSLPQELLNSRAISGVLNRSGIPARHKIFLRAGIQYEIKKRGKENFKLLILTEEYEEFMKGYTSWLSQERAKKFEKEVQEKGDAWIGRLSWDHRYWDDFTNSGWEELKRYLGGRYLYIREDWREYTLSNPLRVNKEVAPHIIGKGGNFIRSLEERAGHRIKIEIK